MRAIIAEKLNKLHPTHILLKMATEHIKSSRNIPTQSYKQNQEPIPKFTTATKKLNKEINADEIKRAV